MQVLQCINVRSRMLTLSMTKTHKRNNAILKDFHLFEFSSLLTKQLTAFKLFISPQTTFKDLTIETRKITRDYCIEEWRISTKAFFSE